MTIYGKILSAICLADLISTVVGIELGFFAEANPILAASMAYMGTAGIILQKILMNISSIVVLELAVRFSAISKKTIRLYYKAAIVSYIVFYLIGVVAASFSFVFR